MNITDIFKTKPKKRSEFLIFFFERSGSTHLVNLLNQHPDINCRGEIFYLDAKVKSDTLSDKRIVDSKKSISILNKLFNKPNKANGFKFKYPNQRKGYPEVWEYFTDRKSTVKMIFLYRSNRLKAAISKQNHTRLRNLTGRSEVTKKSKYETPIIDLNLDDAFRYIKNRENSDRTNYKLAQAFDHVLPVRYEELLSDRGQVIKRIFRFLEVDDNFSPKDEIKKITKDDISQAISNFAALKERLIAHPFEKYLY